MHTILFDDSSRYRLLPFTHTRPVADILCGIFTMRQRWEHFLQQETGTLTEAYMQHVYPAKAAAQNLLINGSVFATQELLLAVRGVGTNERLMHGETVIAARVDGDLDAGNYQDAIAACTPRTYQGEVEKLSYAWDIFSKNEKAIVADFTIATKGQRSAMLPEDVTVRGKEQIFLAEGVKIGAGTIINATDGPVYLAKDAEIMEGCMVRGPFVLGEHAVLKMGAKVYSGSTIGPGCKVGGEISNVVFFANSNKGHDGFLGNSVVGEWCNFGADTNCSNLKNNYDEVKIWDEHRNTSVKTGLTFCGLMMGDHSKCGINTMFNTGTVVGVSCNIYGSNFPEKFIPSFAWGGSEGMTTYKFERAMETAGRMMGRRKKALSEQEVAMYRYLFEHTQKQRNLFAAAL